MIKQRTVTLAYILGALFSLTVAMLAAQEFDHLAFQFLYVVLVFAVSFYVSIITIQTIMHYTIATRRELCK